MTKAQAVSFWRCLIKPVIVQRHSATDKPALRESWNDFVDELQRDGKISERQASTWTQPKI